MHQHHRTGRCRRGGYSVPQHGPGKRADMRERKSRGRLHGTPAAGAGEGGFPNESQCPTRFQRLRVHPRTAVETGSPEGYHPDIAGQENQAHVHDGRVGRTFVRGIAHLPRLRGRLQGVRGENSHRLPDLQDGRGAEHECHGMRPLRRGGLRTGVHRAPVRVRETADHRGNQHHRPHLPERRRL